MNRLEALCRIVGKDYEEFRTYVETTSNTGLVGLTAPSTRHVAEAFGTSPGVIVILCCYTFTPTILARLNQLDPVMAALVPAIEKELLNAKTPPDTETRIPSGNAR